MVEPPVVEYSKYSFAAKNRRILVSFIREVSKYISAFIKNRLRLSSSV